MPHSESHGMLAQAWTALRRSILGKSDPDYVAQLSGDDRYWDEAIAAQLGWPGRRPT